MEREVRAYVDLESVPHFVGHLWARTRGSKESASFEYDPSWLENPLKFSLEPALHGNVRTATQRDEKHNGKGKEKPRPHDLRTGRSFGISGVPASASLRFLVGSGAA
jgi:hypothetical protein